MISTSFYVKEVETNEYTTLEEKFANILVNSPSNTVSNASSHLTSNSFATYSTEPGQSSIPFYDSNILTPSQLDFPQIANTSKNALHDVRDTVLHQSNLEDNVSVSSSFVNVQFQQSSPLSTIAEIRPEVDFIVVPPNQTIEYTGEEILVPLTWVAESTTAGSSAVRKYQLYMLKPESSTKEEPKFPDDFDLLAGEELNNPFSFPTILEDPIGTIGGVPGFFTPGWLPNEPVSFNLKFSTLRTAIVMVFTQVYIKITLLYGFIPLPEPVTEFSYVITLLAVYDDTSPRFETVPEKGNILSTDILREICPSQFPTVEDTLQDALDNAGNRDRNVINRDPTMPPPTTPGTVDCSVRQELNLDDFLYHEEGTPDIVLNYSVIDQLPENYKIEVQVGDSPSTEIEGIWESGEQISYIFNTSTLDYENFQTGFLRDVYLEGEGISIKASFYDKFINFVSHSVNILAQKSTAPIVVENPSSISMIQEIKSQGNEFPEESSVYQEIYSQKAMHPELQSQPLNRFVVYEPILFKNHHQVWTVMEFNPTTYSILKDGNVLSGYENRSYSATNQPSLLLNESGILNLLQLYEFTIILYDILGNSASDTIYVVQIDYSKPVITGQAAYYFVDGLLSTEVLTWVAEDAFPENYTLYFFDEAIESHQNLPWQSKQAVTFQLPDLTQGVHLFTIEFTDQAGNLESFTSVILSNDGPPAISRDQNATYNLASTGNTLFWVPGAGRPTIYEITRDGLFLESGNWTSAERIEHNIDGLATGIYSYKIRFYDEYGRSIVGNSTVTVVDRIQPFLHTIPTDLVLEYARTGISVSFVPEDLEPGNYSIYLEHLAETRLVQANTWSNNEIIAYSLDNFELGVNELLIYFSDVSNNIINVNITVLVVDTTAPQITSLPDISFQSDSSVHQFNITWLVDEHLPSNYRLFRNFRTIVSGVIPESKKLSFLINESEVGLYQYFITVADTSGHVARDFFIVNVFDIKKPIVSNELDYSYQYQFVGNNITWTVDESSPKYYIVEHNGTAYTGDSYRNNVTILIFIDGLDVGVHNFTIIAYDAGDLFGTDTVLITVEDTEPPLLVVKSDNLIYEFGSTGNRLMWRAVDSLPTTYEIYRNDSKIFENTWVFNETILLKVDDLAVSFYHYEIRFYEQSGTYSNGFVNVTVVDTTSPIITFTDDLAVEFNSVGNEFTWYVSDYHPSTYEIRKDGVLEDQGSWQGKTKVVYNVDGLAIRHDYYNYTLTIWDVYQNSASKSFRVLVADTTAPVIVLKPQGFSYEVGETGLNITWSATDLHPVAYALRRNGNLIRQNIWTSNEKLTYRLNTPLGYGDYKYEITFYDQYGNKAVHAIDYKIIDTVSPLIFELPTDNSYEFGSTGNTIQWNASDSDPGTYNITQNGVAVVTDERWLSEEAIILSIDGILVGNYIFTITMADLGGNLVSDDAVIQIVDNTAPSVNSPLDITYNEGRLGYIIYWVYSDYHPNTYRVTNNKNELLNSGQWVNILDILAFSVDNLKVGEHAYTIELSDSYGNTVVDEVTVIVEDTQAPRLTVLRNITYEQGSTGNVVQWSGIDNNPTIYEVYKTGKLISTGSWENSNTPTFIVDGLPLGMHLYQILAFDVSGNFANVTVSVSVRDTIHPVIHSVPNDFIIEFGDLAESRFWNANDLHADNFTITVNGVSTTNGTWRSHQPIYLVVPLGIEIGTYIYQLTISDTSNLVAQSQVLVRVVDTTAPILIEENNKTIEYGSQETYTLNWTAIDRSGTGTYSLSLNNTIFSQNNVWNSEIPITYSFTGLNRGLYRFKIKVCDINGVATSQTVQVLVEDTKAPSLQSTFIPTYQIEESGNITWIAYDLEPSYYQLFSGAQLIEELSWVSGQEIVVNLRNNESGVIIYTFTAYDTSGNQNTSRITILVLDEIAPQITVTTTNLQDSFLAHQVQSIGSLISWTATDQNSGDFILKRNETIISEGSWENEEPISFSLSTLEVGTHRFEIEFTDAAGNKATLETTITIVDTIAPRINAPDDLRFELDDDDYEFTWQIIDSSPLNFTVLRNNSVFFKGRYFSGQEIVIQIQINEISITTYQIIVDDAYKNRNTSTVIVEIEESIAPIIIDELSDVTVEMGDENPETSFLWTAYDRNPTTYELYFDGVLYKIGDWLSSVPNEIVFRNLRTGEYNVTIKAYDVAKQFTTTTAKWTVVDTTVPQVIGQSVFVILVGNSTQFTAEWNALDLNPGSFQILQDGKVLKKETWDNEGVITFEISSDLVIGKYWYAIIISDQFGNSVVKRFSIIVIDITAPEISAPQERTIEYGELSNFTWQLFDWNLHSYKLYINGNLNQSGTVQEQSATITGTFSLPVGTYTFTIVADDSLGNMQTRSTVVTVQDTVSPILFSSFENPLILLYQHFRDKRLINFTAFDYRPGKYYLKFNETVVLNGIEWENFQKITLILGPKYDVTTNFVNFTVVDQGGLASTSLFFVLYLDLHPPVINEVIADEFVEYGQAFNAQWSAYDERPSYFLVTLENEKSQVVSSQENFQSELELLKDDPTREIDLEELTRLSLLSASGTIKADSWTSNNAISVKIENLSVGNYTLSIFQLDKSFGVTTLNIDFVVRDTSAPNITKPQDYINEYDHFQGTELEWVLQDYSPGSYNFWRDNVLVKTGTWVNNEKISTNIYTLTPEIKYNFTIQASDNFGLTTVSTTIVQLFDTIPPQIYENFTDTSFESEEENKTLEWTILEKLPESYSIYVNGELHKTEKITNTTTSVILMLNDFTVGEHNITIVTTDKLSNQNRKVTNVVLQDLTPPQIFVPAEIQVISGEVPQNGTWVAIDQNPSIFYIKFGDLILQSGNWSSGQSQELPLDKLAVGEHHLEIAVYDATGNFHSEKFTVIVEENLQTIIIEENTSNFLVIIIIPFLLIIVGAIAVFLITHKLLKRRHKNKALRTTNRL